MCGIAGFCNVRINYEKNEGEWRTVLNRMKTVQKHRGPDEEGIFLGKHCGLAHVRLSIIDLASGRQPMVKREGGAEFAICYNGELYNMPELKKELLAVQKDPGGKRKTADYDVLLNRYESPDSDNRLPAGMTAVVGHTPTFKYGTQYAGDMIIRDDKIFLDCGAGQGYGLGCLEILSGNDKNSHRKYFTNTENGSIL